MKPEIQPTNTNGQPQKQHTSRKCVWILSQSSNQHTTKKTKTNIMCVFVLLLRFKETSGSPLHQESSVNLKQQTRLTNSCYS